jgi:hypothetical protein
VSVCHHTFPRRKRIRVFPLDGGAPLVGRYERTLCKRTLELTTDAGERVRIDLERVRTATFDRPGIA